MSKINPVAWVMQSRLGWLVLDSILTFLGFGCSHSQFTDEVVYVYPSPDFKKALISTQQGIDSFEGYDIMFKNRERSRSMNFRSRVAIYSWLAKKPLRMQVPQLLI